MAPSRGGPFACEQCRAGKRKCDGAKPQCSLCQRLVKPCSYGPEQSPKKRKYWDEDYVHNLEKQVAALLEVVDRYEKQKGTNSADLPTLTLPIETTLVSKAAGPSTLIPVIQKPEAVDQDRSQLAMEELSVMMWRTNLGDGASIIQSDKHDISYEFRQNNSAETEIGMRDHALPPSVHRHCQDQALLVKLADVFLRSINREHHFTAYRSADFLQGYPYQPIDLALMHTAILAIGAAYLGARDPVMAQISEDFARYAERLVFDSFRAKPSLALVQGLCMLSFRSLSLGRDHLGWMFISMASGLCVHLRLHVLAVDECTARSRAANAAEIRTFWMFYFVDKSAITVLGRNCTLPWRRVNVPDLASILSPTADLADVSFAWQCQLWYSMMQRWTKYQLNAFFRSRSSQLDIKNEAPKPVILFHLQYHMAILIMISPFLRIEPRLKNDGDSEFATSIVLVLRSITASASESIRLCRIYHDMYSFDAAHPQLSRLAEAKFLLAAGGMKLLEQLRVVWPVRADKSITVVRLLANKWGTIGALPLHFSGPVDLSRMAGARNDGNSSSEAPYSYQPRVDPVEANSVHDEYYGAQFSLDCFAYYDPIMEADMQNAFLELANLANIYTE